MVAVALDLTKAFDSVDLTALIKRINYSTASPLLVKWLTQYLWGQQTKTSSLGKTSKSQVIHTGVQSSH